MTLSEPCPILVLLHLDLSSPYHLCHGYLHIFNLPGHLCPGHFLHVCWYKTSQPRHKLNEYMLDINCEEDLLLSC